MKKTNVVPGADAAAGDGDGSCKRGFFPPMPSVSLRVQVAWPALPAGSWDSGVCVSSF